MFKKDDHVAASDGREGYVTRIDGDVITFARDEYVKTGTYLYETLPSMKTYTFTAPASELRKVD